MAILKASYEEAKRLLGENREAMDKIAEFLIEKETITGKEFMEIFHRVTGKRDNEGKNDGDRVSLQKEEGRTDKVQLAKEEQPWKQDV